MDKPFSPSCERNKVPILERLKNILLQQELKLLEVGSGTGQHAVFFSQQFPNVEWVTSDVLQNHSGIKMWLAEAKNKNIKGPLEYEIGKSVFPGQDFDVIFTANTLHIMSWGLVKQFIKELGENLRPGSLVIFYGPFNYGGNYTSHSNQEFDKWLKDRDEESGIRDFEQVFDGMVSHGFELLNDFEMPANNRILLFKR